ncbi:MAG: alanine racemase [Roseburia sp.]|nr:alanine racemase [Roseburia sp.]
MTDATLEKIASEYGTPAFLFDTEALKARMRAIKEIVGEKVHLCYSIKANPFLIPAMLECVEKLEVCSPGELDICKMQQVPGDRIVYSGVNKTRENVNDAVEYESGIYTAESILQFEYLNESAIAHGKVIPVLPRLNAGSQFGMSKEDLCYLVANREQYKGVRIAGIHYFVGTQRKKLTEQKNELAMLKELFAELKSEYDFTVEKLEYGPGLPVPYFTVDDFSDTLAPVKEIAADLQEMAEQVELTVEMGRFYVSECGYYLTKVMDQKSNKGTNYAIVDGGMNHLTYLGQMMGMKVPVIKHFPVRETADEAVNWSLCGSLCTTADVIVRQAPFQNLQLGDVLAFSNIGAYSVTEGIHLFLSRTMPRILLYNGEGAVELARDFMETSSLNCVKR